MLTLYTSGYNVRKRRVEDAVRWFIQKYLPRHHITIEILHRGLRREQAYGYCSVSGEIYRPREFLIEVDPKLDLELYTKTILHELVHLRQWVQGTLKERRGKMLCNDKTFDDLDYWEYPHEVEAHYLEEVYYLDYLRETDQTA
jgi:hypothetical protein